MLDFPLSPSTETFELAAGVCPVCFSAEQNSLIYVEVSVSVCRGTAAAVVASSPLDSGSSSFGSCRGACAGLRAALPAGLRPAPTAWTVPRRGLHRRALLRSSAGSLQPAGRGKVWLGLGLPAAEAGLCPAAWGRVLLAGRGVVSHGWPRFRLARFAFC